MSAATDKRPGFFMIGNAVVDAADLGPYEMAVYIFIVRHVNGKSGVAFPSTQTIADRTHMSKPKAIECIATLETKGLISVNRRYDETGKGREVSHYYVENYIGVVNQNNHTGKPEQLGVVNEVYYNNTDCNNTEEKTSTPATQDVQDTPKSAKYRLLTKAAKDELLPVLFEYGLGKSMASYTPAEITQLMKNRLTAVLKALQPLDDESPISDAELRAAYRWFKKQYRDASYPIGANTLPALLSNYRASMRQATPILKTPALDQHFTRPVLTDESRARVMAEIEEKRRGNS